jgi:hypothetical protein
MGFPGNGFTGNMSAKSELEQDQSSLLINQSQKSREMIPSMMMIRIQLKCFGLLWALSGSQTGSHCPSILAWSWPAAE